MQIDLTAPDLAAVAAAGKLAQNAAPTKTFAKALSANTVGEPKYDGWRLIAVVRDDHVDFYSRTGKTYNVLPHIEAELRAALPPGTIIDGEAVALTVVDGKVLNEWGSVQSALTADGAKTDKISYMVFDLISHRGIDARPLTYGRRRTLLKQLFEQHTFHAVQLTPQVEPTKPQYEKLLAQGFEGMVVKRLDKPYGSDKREGAGWTKAKPTITIEGVVMGFTEGKAGFSGLIGAVVFGQHGECPTCGGSGEQGAMVNPPDPQTYESGPCSECHGDGLTLIERGRVSGMGMRTRIEMTQHPDEWLGKVIEIVHEGFSIGQGDGGGFRFPRMKRVRPDKDPVQVVLHDE